MIDRRNDITVAAQMSTKICGGPPASTTVMGVNDQRVSSSVRGSIAYGHLPAPFVTHANCVDVLSFRCHILTRMPSRSGVPDLAGKHAVSCRVASLDCPDAGRKYASVKWVVLHRSTSRSAILSIRLRLD